MTNPQDLPRSVDAVVIGAGHNGLVAAIFLARAGLSVAVLEAQPVLGGAARTEYPFAKAPRLGISTGAYLLGLVPPELLQKLGISLPLRRRDPHYFLPTAGRRHLLFGSNTTEMQRQFIDFFSEQDFQAASRMQEEIGQIRDDIAGSWLLPPLSLEETAQRHVRPSLRNIFIDLCRGTIGAYLERFQFQSDLLKAMYATTDGFSGLSGGYDSPGTGLNFLVHNMCRLPGSDGTWMILEGGMGTLTRALSEQARAAGALLQTGAGVKSIELDCNTVKGVVLENGARIEAKVVVCNADPFRARDLVGAAHLPADLNQQLNGAQRNGHTMKVNLCLKKLPTFTCLPEERGQHGATIHLLPDEDKVLDSLRRAHQDALEGRLPEFPTIEWYMHTAVDPSLRDPEGRHNAALFVQWVPYSLSDGRDWRGVEAAYARHLLSICDRFAPGTSDLVEDMFVLSPPGIERYFGITRGHIHHFENSLGFTDRPPYRFGPQGFYLCGAGTHPAGAVIGAGGHNAAACVLSDFGKDKAAP